MSLGGGDAVGELGLRAVASQIFVIVRKSGAVAVSGTFAGLAEGAAFTVGSARFHISYAGGDGNDVVLIVDPYPPGVTKVFSPTSIAPQATSMLTLTLMNTNATSIAGAAFTDTYPSGLVNAAVPNVATTCGGVAAATAGGNTVALAQLRDGREGSDWRGWAQDVKVLRTAFKGGGSHVNLTGAAIAKHAPHPAAARKFLEFLVTPAAQTIFAAAELEYPVLAGAKQRLIVDEIGSFPADTASIDEIAAQQQAAVALIRKAGVDE